MIFLGVEFNTRIQPVRVTLIIKAEWLRSFLFFRQLTVRVSYNWVLTVCVLYSSKVSNFDNPFLYS